MYSMVILDDEKIVLQGIQKLCQKEDFGFVIKGAFVDSLKALDALPGLRPHLIITDVRMPQMDGLEFARRAKEILPESEIVILSGYRDFSYAQTAMQIGVSDYLLKPIKKTDFGDMLHRMYERLEAKIGQAAYYQVLDGYARGLVGEEEVKHAVFFRTAGQCGAAPRCTGEGRRAVAHEDRAGCPVLHPQTLQ